MPPDSCCAVMCTPSGTVWTRQHYLDGLVDGTINYRRSGGGNAQHPLNADERSAFLAYA